MTHRIKKVTPMDSLVVSVIFQDGVEVEYDIINLFAEFPQFNILQSEKNIFEQVKVDVGGCGLCWNDELDIDAEEIWKNGRRTGKRHEVSILDSVANGLMHARDVMGITQKELADRTQIYQADISKIERGLANPSVKTLQRLADGLGMELQIQFVKTTNKGV